MVFLAWMGFGVYSFVLPLVLVALFEWYVLYRYAGHWPMRGARFEISEAKELFRKSKWIVLTAFSSMLIMQGSTLVLSFSKVENLISSFFFGFQLTSAISSLMTTCFSSVLLPSFKEIENRGENLNKAYQDITYKVIFVSAVLFSLYYLVGPIFVNLVWQGKWDSAIPVIQFLGLGIIFRMPNPIGSALLEARGLWKLNAQLSYVNAVGTVCFTAVGVWLGGLYEVALCVACFRLCYGTFQVVVVARVMDMSILPFVIKLYQPVLYCLGLVLILGYIDFGLTALVQVGLKVLVYAILTFPWLIYLYDFNRGGSKVYE
jgi:O-antigen/teichoic acid export membrane protein